MRRGRWTSRQLSPRALAILVKSSRYSWSSKRELSIPWRSRREYQRLSLLSGLFVENSRHSLGDLAATVSRPLSESSEGIEYSRRFRIRVSTLSALLERALGALDILSENSGSF